MEAAGLAGGALGRPGEQDEWKRAAAVAALAEVASGMTIGLGTGSTAELFVRALAERKRQGLAVTGVATSDRTAALASALGIPLVELDAVSALDASFDGADEVTLPGLDLVKGRGGALLHEKLVAVNSRRLVIVVDPTKLVQRLGERAPLPVAVVPFGWTTQLECLYDLGAVPTLRTPPGEPVPYTTDDGHYIIDALFPGGISDPAALADALARRPGVVETGLFLGMSPEVVVGRWDER